MIKRNENTAELVGLSFGDGSFTSRKEKDLLRFQLRGNASEDKKHYDGFIIPLFNKEVMAPLFNRNVATICDKKGNCFGISLESKKIQVLNSFLGIPIGIKNNLHIPEWIKSSVEYQRAFLRGIFDTDGCIYFLKNNTEKNPQFHKRVCITITLCSELLIQEISNILKGFQIGHDIREYTPKNRKWQKSYTIRLAGGKRVSKWFKDIGSNNPKHITKFEIWKRFGFCNPRTTLKERESILRSN